MVKQLSIVIVLCGFSLIITSCSDDASYNEPYCADEEAGLICEPSGFPFTDRIGVRSDACAEADKARGCSNPTSETTVTLTQPESGKVCVQGSVTGRMGWVWLLIGVGAFNKTLTAAPTSLHAKDLGITQLSFNLESPPSNGFRLFALTVRNKICRSGPPECLSEVYYLMADARSNTPVTFTAAGPQTALLTNFRGDDPTHTPDSNALHDFVFEIAPGDYDFCISDLKFLDQDGAEVSP